MSNRPRREREVPGALLLDPRLSDLSGSPLSAASLNERRIFRQ